MSLVLNGSSQSGNVNSAIVTGQPVSIAAWVKLDTLPNQYFAGIFQPGTAAKRIVWANVSNPRALSHDGTSFGNAESTDSLTTGVWSLIVGVFSTDAQRYCALNGGTRGSDTTSLSSWTAANSVYVGRNPESEDRYMDGKIAHVGIWDVALSEADEDSLYNSGSGQDFRNVQSSNLKAYWPLNDDGNDIIGANNLTLNNSPTFDDADDPFTVSEGGLLIAMRNIFYR